MGLRYAPFCFTEQGVTMLSCILNSSRAIEVNIQLIRIFMKLREMIMTNKDILLKLELIEKQAVQHNSDIETIFNVLKELLQNHEKPRVQIGY